MRKGKILGKIFGIVLVFVLIGRCHDIIRVG